MLKSPKLDEGCDFSFLFYCYGDKKWQWGTPRRDEGGPENQVFNFKWPIWHTYASFILSPGLTKCILVLYKDISKVKEDLSEYLSTVLAPYTFKVVWDITKWMNFVLNAGDCNNNKCSDISFKWIWLNL